MFLIVGTLTVIIDFLTYRLLLWPGVLEIDISKAISFLVGTLFAYFANRFWTFGHKGRSARSAIRFVLLYSLTLGANVAINALILENLHGVLGVFYLAFLVATGVSAALNFVGMKLFVFRKTSPSASHETVPNNPLL